MLIGIRVEIVVMDVFWVVFTMPSVLFNIEATVWNVIPSGLRFIGKENMGTVVPLEPSPQSLGEHPSFFVVTLVEPMVVWAFVGTKGVEISWELSLEAWNDIVEWESVGGQMYPS